MNNLYELIVSLEELERERMAVLEKEARITKPVISDLERMDEVYEAFREIRPDKDARSIFLLIAVRLFCPKAIVKNMGHGVRRKVANVLKCKPTVVSHAYENLVFHYKQYQGFRKEVDEVYGRLCGKLGIE